MGVFFFKYAQCMYASDTESSFI